MFARKLNQETRYRYIEFAIFALLFFYLYIITSMAFAFDDAHMASLERGKALISGGYFKAALSISSDYISMGRFQISHFVQIPIYMLPMYGMRLFIILMTILDVFLFGKIMYQFTKSYAIKLYSMIFMIAFFQIVGNNYSQMFGLGGLIQNLTAIFLISILFLGKYHETKKTRYIFLSCILFLILVLYYESCLVFFPIYLIINYYYTKKVKAAVKYTVPYFCIFVAWIFFNIYLRSQAQVQYEGTAMNWQLESMAVAFLKQIVSAIPLSNMLFVNGFGYIAQMIKDIQPFDIVKAVLFATIIYFVWNISKNQRQNKLDLKSLFILLLLGLFTVALPAVPVALSQLYQGEIQFGKPHFIAFVECFGLLISFFAVYKIVFRNIESKKKGKIILKIVRIAIVSLFAFIILLNSVYARNQVELVNQTYGRERIPLENALESGILNDVEDDAVIVNYGITLPQNNTYYQRFYATYAQKVMDVYEMDLYKGKIIDNMADYDVVMRTGDAVYIRPEKEHTYVVQIDQLEYDYIKMGEVISIVLDADSRSVQDFLVNDVKISLSPSAGNGDFDYIVYYTTVNQYGIEEDESKLIKREEVLTDSSDENILDIDFDGQNVLMNSIVFNRYISYKPGECVSFSGQTADSGISLVKNWSQKESWGRWSVGDAAKIGIVLNEQNDYLLKIEALGYHTLNGKPCEVYINGKLLGIIELTDKPQTYELNIDKKDVDPQLYAQEIKFKIDSPISPKQVGGGEDDRILGIGIKYVELQKQ